VLGGPLTNVVLLFIAIVLLPLDKQLDETPFDGVAPFLFLALSNSALLLFSLWPRMVNSTKGRVPNDALLLWKILRTKRTEIIDLPSLRFLYEADERRRKKDLAGAQRWIIEGLEQFPKSIPLKMMAATILYIQKKYHESARAFALLAGRNKGSKVMDAHILNGIAYSYLLTGNPKLIAKADICSRLAWEQAPNFHFYKGTRGSVLVELGRYEEGLKLLHEALKGHPDNAGQALNACYIGIAEARRGNPADSRNYFAIARRLDPECILLEREQNAH
jgi:tetratricopeptide (TPR) repeat protein